MKLVFGAAALTAAQWSHAVVIQGLKPLSALGQPLRAEVTLGDVQAADLRSLRVRISPTEAYQAATLTRIPELNQAKVTVRAGANHTAVVELSTTVPIHAPVVDLLLDVEWATGQLNQQFAVLLDAPAAATKGAPEAANVAQPQAVQAQPEAPITVVRGDTLSELMLTHRYGVGSMAQRLIATQRANTQAFIRDNVNWVRAGAKLRLPSRDAILAIDAQEAQRLVNTQMADFEAYRRDLAAQARTSNAQERAGQGEVENAVGGGAQAPKGDRLALTNGAAVAQDAQVAADKAKAAAQDRQGELAENIKALKDLAASLPDSSTPSVAAKADAGKDKPSTAATTTGQNEATPPATSSTPSVQSDLATSARQEPQWIADMKSKPWLLPAVGVLLLLLALWVWLRRAQAPKPAEASALNEAAEVANDGDLADDLPDDPELPTLDPESETIAPRELSALLPDVDLDLPNLDDPAPQAQDEPISDISLLEQAKSRLRNGDAEGARALAEEALTSPDPMIQDNAKAFLERL